MATKRLTVLAITAVPERVSEWLWQSKMIRAEPEGRRTPTSPDPSNVMRYEALARLLRELRKFQEFSKNAAKKAGLTSQQHQALLSIRGLSSSEPVSIGDVANVLLVAIIRLSKSWIGWPDLAFYPEMSMRPKGW